MIDEDDPEYRIAYDADRYKVGCVLIQAVLGGTVPRDLFSRYFDTDTWTLDASACIVYPIRRSRLGALAARTRPGGRDEDSRLKSPQSPQLPTRMSRAHRISARKSKRPARAGEKLPNRRHQP